MSTNLPPTAYVKMLDCWLIFSLLKPFVDILVQTYIHALTDNLQALSNWKIEFGHIFVRVVYPIFFLVFIIIFWLLGLIYYYYY